jgi:hypothetical protein
MEQPGAYFCRKPRNAGQVFATNRETKKPFSEIALKQASGNLVKNWLTREQAVAREEEASCLCDIGSSTITSRWLCW